MRWTVGPRGQCEVVFLSVNVGCCSGTFRCFLVSPWILLLSKF